MGLSLASLSCQVSALERRFGGRLMHRTTRRLALSESGRELYAGDKRILGEVGALEQPLSEAARSPTGRLHLSTPSLLGRLHVAPLLPEFLARHPHVAVDLTLADRPLDLLEYGVKMALRIGRLPPSRLVARKLGSVHLIVCAAPDYLARRGVPEHPAALAAHDCLVFNAVPQGAEWHFAARGRGRLRALAVPARLAANTLESLVTAALGGAGLVRAPCWQVAEHLATGRLVRVLAGYERPAAPIHALFPPDRPLAAKTRAFADFLVAHWAPPPFECPAARTG